MASKDSMIRIFDKAGAETITVNTGFNWWAFFFPGLWALFNGLLFAGSLGIAIQMSVLFLDDIFVALVTTVIMFVYGFKGNDWVSSKLEQAGYTLSSRAQPSEVTDHKPDVTDHGGQPEVGGHGESQTVMPRDRLQNNYHFLNNQNEIYNGGTGYKKCKFCAEDIKKEAIKCRFCGEFVVAEESDLSDKTRSEMSTINDDNSLDERILCRDGTCVGTVGKDGKCRYCGLSNE